jgi:hypothetical protein
MVISSIPTGWLFGRRPASGAEKRFSKIEAEVESANECESWIVVSLPGRRKIPVRLPSELRRGLWVLKLGKIPGAFECKTLSDFPGL